LSRPRVMEEGGASKGGVTLEEQRVGGGEEGKRSEIEIQEMLSKRFGSVQ
jgi:hypothetical protein